MTTSVYPYIFDNMARIGNDNTAIDQRSIQNINNANYNLENFYGIVPLSKATELAYSQPNIFINSGYYEGGIKGSEIEKNNDLKYTHITRPACKLSLMQRPFLTVPYLGKGLGDPETEYKLLTGNVDLNKKSVNYTMEQNFSNYHNYPLIDSIKDSILNTSYKIEDDAMEGWQRGGLSARNYAKDNNK